MKVLLSEGFPRSLSGLSGSQEGIECLGLSESLKDCTELLEGSRKEVVLLIKVIPIGIKGTSALSFEDPGGSLVFRLSTPGRSQINKYGSRG